MEVIIVDNQDQGSVLGASFIANVMKKKNNAVLGLATGKTPILLYEELVRLYRIGELDFSNIKSFNLDEYYKVEPIHTGSYHYFMNYHLFSKVNIKKENVHVPNGLTDDVEKECVDYENSIKKAGGVDIQLLGIGRDGHIGFNEPSCSLTSRTRLETLTEDTREANLSDFGKQELVPYHAVTMGIGTIMESREIVLLGFGKSKADAIAGCVEGPVSAMCPSSILQMHNNVKIIIDNEAASKLTKVDYYKCKYTYKSK